MLPDYAAPVEPPRSAVRIPTNMTLGGGWLFVCIGPTLATMGALAAENRNPGSLAQEIVLRIFAWVALNILLSPFTGAGLFLIARGKKEHASQRLLVEQGRCSPGQITGRYEIDDGGGTDLSYVFEAGGKQVQGQTRSHSPLPELNKAVWILYQESTPEVNGLYWNGHLFRGSYWSMALD